MRAICPICGELGYLQKVNPRFFRVRHYICKHPSRNTGYPVSMFSYCKVSTEWAQEQIKAKEELYRRCFGKI